MREFHKLENLLASLKKSLNLSREAFPIAILSILCILLWGMRIITPHHAWHSEEQPMNILSKQLENLQSQRSVIALSSEKFIYRHGREHNRRCSTSVASAKFEQNSYLITLASLPTSIKLVST